MKQASLAYLYEREKIASTVYGNLVAIPLPVTPQTDETFLTVCTLTNVMAWKDKPAQYICLLNIKRNSQEDLQPIYDLLGAIVNSETIVQQLLKVDDCTSFIKVLNDFNNKSFVQTLPFSSGRSHGSKLKMLYLKNNAIICYAMSRELSTK
nr:PTS sugar transporter subunit IIA [Virgibacillus proomii]